VRNQGTSEFLIYRTQQLCELGIDGQWYRHKEVSAKSSPFPPGKQYNGIDITLDKRWYSKGAYEPLQLPPGKHIIHVTFVLSDARKGGIEPPPAPVRAVSNPVRIEILPDKHMVLPDHSVSLEKLRQLGKALVIYANDDEAGRFPNTLRQLAKRDYLSEKDLAWYLANVEYLGKGKTAADPPGEPIAYDKALLRSRETWFTNVLFNDGHVALQDPQHLHELGIYMFVFPEGAISKISQFRKALAASDWDKASSYCSDRVKAAARKYESVEAFFRDIVPVEAVIGKPDMLRHPVKGGYNLWLGGLLFFRRSAPGDAEEELWWQFLIDKRDAAWVIDFETKSIRDRLEQRKKDRLRTAALEKERQALRKAFQWKLEAVKAKTRLTPVSKEFVVGRPMLFRLELVNEGKVEFLYDHQQVAVNSSMTITDKKGERVPYTFGPVQTDGSHKAIKAGKSAILFDNLDISSQYDLSKAGKYKVQFNGKGLYTAIGTGEGPFENTIGIQGKFPSNIVEIEVSAPEKQVRREAAAARFRTPELVRKQLDRIVDLSRLRPEMSFSDALKELKKSVRPPLSIVVLWSDLEQNADIDRTTPIDMEGVSAIRLGTALELLLQSISADVAELGYVVTNGVIVIATKESLPSTMETRVYDI
jgi:prepilin-type processing-associated H-X9-DG protein